MTKSSKSALETAKRITRRALEEDPDRAGIGELAKQDVTLLSIQARTWIQALDALVMWAELDSAERIRK